MRYGQIVEGVFLSRPNRFVARVMAGGEELRAHVRNTGRCRELLVPGARVYLEGSDNPHRKTPCSLIAVWKGDRLINMDSQAPNQVVAEALENGWRPPGISEGAVALRREVAFEASRFDFCLSYGGRQGFLEVKGVTLEEGGAALFPDAPTERGVKHIRHLIRARQSGYGAWVLFVIQMDRVDSFSPNDATHPAFGAALREARAEGVGILACSCRVEPDSLVLDRPVRVVL